jgi:hypothetical protein
MAGQSATFDNYSSVDKKFSIRIVEQRTMTGHKLSTLQRLFSATVDACQAFSSETNEDLISHLEAWEDARDRYYFDLANSDLEISEEQFQDLQDHLEAMLRAAQAGDYVDFMSESSRALSALPGDPVIGPKPPRPKVTA